MPSQEVIELRMRLQGVMEECQRLREEVRYLKSQLPVSEPPVVEQPTIHTTLSRPERVTLFRSLFRGREDVYAVRVQFKKDGQWGYRSP